MSTLKTTFIQHPSAEEPSIELSADGSIVLPLSGIGDLADVDEGSGAVDGDVLTYDGVSDLWVPAPVSGLVAVKHALFTGTQAVNPGSKGNFAVTDLTITHTLADAANKLIIFAYLGVAENSRSSGTSGIGVADNGALIAVGTAISARTPVSQQGVSPSVTFVYEPGDTVAHTYTVRGVNVNNVGAVVYINREAADTDNGDFPRASSGFVIQEVRP
jgi:hypothetical protein